MIKRSENRHTDDIIQKDIGENLYKKILREIYTKRYSYLICDSLTEYRCYIDFFRYVNRLSLILYPI